MMNGMPGHPTRRTSDLLIGRFSRPRFTYFVTLCEVNRQPVLTEARTATAIRDAILGLHQAADLELVAGTLMPDHVHLLFVLGERLSLSRIIGKLKTQTSGPLRDGAARWQDNYYDHRLREADAREPFAKYIFLNPYRANLLSRKESWAHWFRAGPINFAFEEAVRTLGEVPREWLDEPIPTGVV